MSARCFSLNQIEHSARKAVRGVGISWGLAEDTGRAVRWLQAAGVDGVSVLVRVLSELDRLTVADRNVALTGNDRGWRAQGPDATLIGGAAMADCIIANDLACGGGTVNDRLQLDDLTLPVLTAGFAGVASAQSGVPCWLRWDDVVIGFAPGSAKVQGTGSALMAACASVSLFLQSPAGFRPDYSLSPQHCARNRTAIIDPATWAALERFAHRTYVPATEASRLGGAGAGTLDND